MYKLIDKKDIDFLIDICGEENVLVGSDINEDFLYDEFGGIEKCFEVLVNVFEIE